jgi:hypothetical protein
MAVRVELSCMSCGHSTNEVIVPGSGRPSFRELRLAYEAKGDIGGPLWVGDQPRCPRCKGQLFMEGIERTALRRAS